ncbi:hypothetical protein BJX76DRAFT_358718 [Aspergillus varians]
MTINVGIIDYGSSAKNYHIPFISAVPEYEMIAVLQRTEAPVDISSAAPGSYCTVDLPGIGHHRTPDEFFADPDTALIVVATHIDTHSLFAERALTATDIQTLRKLLSQNALGTITEAELHYDFESPFWLKYMTEKKYTPGQGQGHSFALALDQAYTLFGRPSCVTAFFRSQRGIESEIEDSYTIILLYTGEQSGLLVTVKSAVTTPLARQLKLFVRRTEGSFVKWQQRSTCPQEEQIAQGAKLTDPGFGVEPEKLRGELMTYKEFDSSVQMFDPETGKYTGLGAWVGVYENVVGAICGREELEVRPGQVRDVLRNIELARESHGRGVMVAWEGL